MAELSVDPSTVICRLATGDLLDASVVEFGDMIHSTYDIINVRDSTFGAKGDGVTDDSTAIQAAIESGNQSGFPAGSRIIYFPTGRYRVENTLNVYDHTMMVGQGQAIDTGVELWFYGASADNCLETVASASAVEKGMFWLQNIRVKDKRTSPSAGTGLKLETFKNGTRILHSEISDFPDYQFHFTAPSGSTSDRLYISNSWFSTTSAVGGTSLVLIERTVNNVSIENSYFDHLASGCAAIEIGDNVNASNCIVNVSNCSFESDNNTTGASIKMGESHGSVNIQNVEQTSTGSGSHVVDMTEGFDGNLTLINVNGEKHGTWGSTPHTLNIGGTLTRYVDGRIGFCDVVAAGHPVRVGLAGSGSPESSVYGSVGEIYTDYGGGAGATIYVKESGNMTNTGWVACLMNSEVDADIKTLTLPASVTIHDNCTEVGGVLDASVGDQGTPASTTETTLHSYTLPAGQLANDGDALQVKVWGFTAANANNKRIRFKFGATTVYDSGAVAANNTFVVLNWRIVREGATAQWCYSDGLGFYNTPIFASKVDASETLSGSVVIAITGENGTASANDLVIEGMTVEYLPAP